MNEWDYTCISVFLCPLKFAFYLTYLYYIVSSFLSSFGFKQKCPIEDMEVRVEAVERDMATKELQFWSHVVGGVMSSAYIM